MNCNLHMKHYCVILHTQRCRICTLARMAHLLTQRQNIVLSLANAIKSVPMHPFTTKILLGALHEAGARSRRGLRRRALNLPGPQAACSPAWSLQQMRLGGIL